MPESRNNMKEPLSNIDNGLIWGAFKKGKKWAFEKIYRHTYNDLYRFGVKFIQNSELVEDIIQDLYFKLWQRKETLATPSNIKAYLLSSVRATIINHIKKDSRNTELVNLDNFNFESSAEELYIIDESFKENIRILNDELNKLTSKQKEAIYLHYILELDYKEVSVIMNIKMQSVRNLVYESLAKLKLARRKFSR